MLDKTMLNTSPGSRWEAMWARISSGMSQSVAGEVFIFLAGGSMPARGCDMTPIRQRLVRYAVTHPRKCR